MNNDYYIAMGLVYTNKYEFPIKSFYYATSQDFQFKPFPALNDQHKEEYNKLKSIILGNPKHIHKKVEADKEPGQEENEESIQKQEKEIDPLASSEEEDENAKILPVNLKEIDRIHYIVRAIENDCQVIP